MCSPLPGRQLWSCVLLVAISLSASAWAGVVIIAPQTRAVFQRDLQGGAFVEVRCDMDEVASQRLEVRAVSMDESRGATDWEDVIPSRRESVHSLRLEAGWYRIEVRTLEEGVVTSEAIVERVGVGEVFITAGQSNSANHGHRRLAAEEDRVSAWGPDGWQHAEDPQPIATGLGGTPWPALGDLLVRDYGVPVGFISVGWGGTAVGAWLPEGTRYPRLRDALEVVEPHGVRAILWHQGETDNLLGTTTEEYVERLQTVIAASRRDAGFDVPWGIALVSFAETVAGRIIEAQRTVIAVDPLAFTGPATDTLVGVDWRPDALHFNERGLREHAHRWWVAIEDAFDLSERPHPSIVLSAPVVSEGEELTLSAEGSYAEGGRELVDWQWDFGDGSTANGFRASHAYETTGLRRVSLQITDSDGHRQTTTATVLVQLRSESVAPWRTGSVGSDGFSGGQSLQGDCLVLAGGGSGFARSGDAFRFIYRELTGDFALTARLADLRVLGPAEAGLLLRDTLDEGAEQIGVFRWDLDGSSSVFARVRSERLSRRRGTAIGSTAAWLRLERRGLEVIALSSDDAMSWEEHWREELDIRETVLAGFAVTSDETADETPPLPTFATFCDVTLDDLDLAFQRGDCSGDGQVVGTVTDAVFLFNFLLLGRAEPPCLASCDADGDGELGIADSVYLLRHRFGFGAPPPAPYPSCGRRTGLEREPGCQESSCP